MNTYDELQEWAEARATMETQSYEEMRADTEAKMERFETITNITVIVSFLYALTLIARAVKKIKSKFQRRKDK